MTKREFARSLQVDQCPDGHSNLVYLIRADGRGYVLRRPPLGPVAPRAHDMAREYRMPRAVHPHFPESPEALLLCEDTSVPEAAFFLMERREGVVPRDAAPKGWNPRQAGRLRAEAGARCHPLAGVGLSLCYWIAPDSTVSAIISQPGWFTRTEFLERYERATGRDVSNISSYEILGVFKLAVIPQQIYFRFTRRQTRDERCRSFEGRVRGLVRLAADIAERNA